MYLMPSSSILARTCLTSSLRPLAPTWASKSVMTRPLLPLLLSTSRACARTLIFKGSPQRHRDHRDHREEKRLIGVPSSEVWLLPCPPPLPSSRRKPGSTLQRLAGGTMDPSF